MKAKWTFMVYLAGDNTALSYRGEDDIEEMRVGSIGSTEEVHIVAQFDKESDGANRYWIHNGIKEKVKTLGKIDSGDPNTLIDFINGGVKDYPAERYALVLWGHGSGWEPSEMDDIARDVGWKVGDNKSMNYLRESTKHSASPLRRVFFRTSLKKILSDPSPLSRAVCGDDDSGHSLDTIELGKVLTEAKKTLGQPLDLLGMDACLMSDLEVAYQVQPYVKYMVASEATDPNNGWPYDMVLKELVQTPNLPPQDLASHIVRACVKYYVDLGYTGTVTQSALALSWVNNLANHLDNLAEALTAHMPKAKTEVYDAQCQSFHDTRTSLWDILHFSEGLCNLTSNEAVREAAKSVRSALQSGPNSFVIAESHHGNEVNHCGGVTIYLVPQVYRISKYYKDLRYAQEHRWKAMLEKYHAP